MRRSQVRRRHSVSRKAADFVWSPAQVVAGAIGVFLVVLGGVALARTGLGSLTEPTTTVWLFDHAPLLGLINVGAGLLFLVAASGAVSGRGMLVGLGFLALAFGLIVAIEPAAFVATIGAGSTVGWLYGVIGLLSLITGWASPVVVVERRVEDEGAESDMGERDTHVEIVEREDTSRVEAPL
jgi:hypothetical protein